MTTIWILVVLTLDKHFIGPTNINFDALAYDNAASCLRNASSTKSDLLKKHSEVIVECVEQRVNE